MILIMPVGHGLDSVALQVPPPLPFNVTITVLTNTSRYDIRVLADETVSRRMRHTSVSVAWAVMTREFSMESVQLERVLRSEARLPGFSRDQPSGAT
jgi:hypothetical protein